MTSKKLSSKRIFAVCKTQLYQMRLLLILFGLVFAVIPTLYTAGELSNWYENQYDLRYIKQFVMGVLEIGGFIPMFGLGMAMAVMQFGYLHKRQKLDYFHAIPVLRSEHFLGRVTAALIALVSASALIVLGQFFAILVSFGITGDGLLQYIFWRCFWIVLPAFSAYLFTVLMIVLTATLWETVFSLLIISALSPAIVLFTYVLITSSIPMHAYFDMWDAIAPFSPLIFSIYFVSELASLENHLLFTGMIVFGVLHVLLCGGLAMLFFCKRRSEMAESNMPTRFKLLVRFSASFCASAFGSVVLLWITEDYTVYWIGAVIGLLAAWLIMELLYTRSVRKAMRALWVNLLGFAVFITINVLVMFGIIGLPEIPEAEDVYAVSVVYGKGTLTADGAGSYKSFSGRSESVFTEEGRRYVSSGTWNEKDINAGVDLAKVMLENQKELYFPYIPRHWGGYSPYGVTYSFEDEADEMISYDVTLQLYANGRAQSLSYGDVDGRGRISELYDRAKAISESEEYRMSDPALTMMENLDYVHYMNYSRSETAEIYEMRDVEDADAFIERLQAAYQEDVYDNVWREDAEILEKYAASTEPVPTEIADEYILYMDMTRPITLRGGILDSNYPAEGLECWLSAEYVPGAEPNEYTAATREAIYLTRVDHPRACAILDELRVE